MPLSRKAIGSLATLLFGGWSCHAQPDQSQWLDVPFVRQVEAGCGAASIAMIMQYWIRQDPRLDPVTADSDRIYQLLAPSPGKGISGQALKSYLEQQGYDAFVFGGELGDLRHHLGKGRPLVVSLAPGGAQAPLHYVVVVGLTDSSVMLHDPARGKLIREGRERYERNWRATGRWTLLAVPRQRR